MINRVFRLLLIMSAVLALFMAVSATVFAEGDLLCSGKFMGTANITNPNTGEINFDSHEEGADPFPPLVDLSIALGTGSTGYAPSRQYAACVSGDDDTFGPLPEDEYIVRGFSWSDNIGFISYYCDGLSGYGRNELIDCGDYDYKVMIGAESGGTRQLSGYAWNEAYGYIDFHPAGYAGVTMDDATGALSGYAWAEAQIWIDFSGVTAELPGEELPEEDWCDGHPYVCISVTPDPEELGNLATGFLDDVPLANGEEGFEINLYLREDDGVTPLDEDDYEIGPFTFNWVDTVKINQLAGEEVGDALNEVSNPWEAGKGGIIYKPVDIDFKEFTEVIGDPGHYVLSDIVRSYSPTTNMNVSYTTSTQPPVPYLNELFIEELGEVGDIWSRDIEPNNLELESIGFSLIRKSDGLQATSPQVEYPNGKDGLNFSFRPPVEIDTLYAEDLQDTIVSFRNIPVNFKVGTRANGKYDFTFVNIDLMLDYSKVKTASECALEGATMSNFDFKFIDKDSSGWSGFIPEFSLGSADRDIQAVATLPEPGEGDLPCSVAQGPTLYSIISYGVVGDGAENKVSYYGNKLPRITSLIVNPSAVVHGNIYATRAFSPTAEHQTQATGNVAIDIVRNTVNENVKKYIKEVTISEKGECVVNALLEGMPKVTGCDSSYYVNTQIKGENVLYFKNSDVTLSLDKDGWEGRWVIIQDGGKMFINEDVYRETGESGLAIVQMRPYKIECAESNIYIDSNVKNVQANIVTDCSLFSYDSAFGYDKYGFPDWNGSFTNMVNSLSNQLLIEGSIASRNTIGGADLDSEALGSREYLLLGTGEVLPLPVTAQGRMLAQVYDLNYLRLFKLDIENAPNGLPIDQDCLRALTVQDMIDINEGALLYGERYNYAFDPPQPIACDGIEPLEIYDPANDKYGDLVPPKTGENLARGLDNEKDFDPIYIFYTAPDSFVFEKAGGVSLQ